MEYQLSPLNDGKPYPSFSQRYFEEPQELLTACLLSLKHVTMGLDKPLQGYVM